MPWTRILSGTVAIAIALGLLTLGGWYFTCGLGIMVYLGLEEYFQLVRLKGMMPAARTTLVVSQLLLIVANLMPSLTDAILPVSAILICAWLQFKPKPSSIADIAASILGLFYTGYLPSYWVRLRSLGAAASSNLPLGGFWPDRWLPFNQLPPGLALLLLAFLCIWAADIGAYFMGRWWGRTKLTQVSPKKTVEGAISGLLGSMTVATIGAFSLAWPYPLLTGLGLGLIIGGCSLLGDLTESMMKRDAGVKDSGQIIPGHGGILDRTDSYIFTAPMMYYFVTLLLPLLR